MSQKARRVAAAPLSPDPHRPLLIGWVLLVGMTAGCAKPPIITPIQAPLRPLSPLPQARGSYYQVQRGESLWRIAHDFGWETYSLARVNHLSSPRQVSVGQRLFIPPPPESNRFLWPARGALSDTSGESSGRGIEIRSPEGSFVRASRTGRVAVATRQLIGWGNAIVLDHGDGYVTVYAGLEQLLVNPGATVLQGNTLGQMGRGPLYFEIRYGMSPRDPHHLLP